MGVENPDRDVDMYERKERQSYAPMATSSKNETKKMGWLEAMLAQVGASCAHAWLWVFVWLDWSMTK